jgi:hypothetical protein
MKRLSGIMMTLVFTAFFAIQGFNQTSVAKQNQGDDQKANQQKSMTTGNFVDKNNNGICDHFEARGTNGHGRNFVDKNGDGKCDNCQSDCKGKGNGNCCRKEFGCRHGNPGAGKACCEKGSGYQHRHGCYNMNQEPIKTTQDNQEK